MGKSHKNLMLFICFGNASTKIWTFDDIFTQELYTVDGIEFNATREL